MSRTLVSPQLLTPPAGYPVTVAEVKAQLDIQSDDFDARLAGLIATATEDVEAFLGRALITRQYHAYLDRWPHAREGGGDMGGWPAAVGDTGRGWLGRWIELPMPPLISVDYVRTYDDSDVATTMDPATYYVDTASQIGRLVLRDGQQWPNPTRVANGIEIAWTAGVGATLRPFVDETIRLALVIAVGILNEQRGDEGSKAELPSAARDLLIKKRVNWL